MNAPPDKPAAPQINFAAIPHELRERSQWVCWRFKWKPKEGHPGGGKWTKPPCTAVGSSASTTNPSTWADFETARAAVEAGDVDGLGYVFVKADPYVGIDLDGCIRGGGLRDDAVHAVKLLDSYTEASPSGTGLHIIVRSEHKLPGPGKCDNAAGREMYEAGRFLTFTGGVHDGHDTIRHVNGEVAELYGTWWPQEVVNHAQDGASGLSGRVTGELADLPIADKWKRLIASGDGMDAYNDDRSAAAFAVCLAMVHANVADGAILDALTDQRYFLAAAALERRRNRQSARDWVLQHCLEPAKRKRTDAASLRFSGAEPVADGEAPSLAYDTLTQAHNADRLLAVHGDRIRWTPEVGWLRWDGRRWKPDVLGAVRHDCEQVIRGLFAQVAGINDAELSKKVVSFIQRSLSAGHVQGVLELTQYRPGIAQRLTEYDADDGVLNTESGVVDLAIGSVAPHDPVRRISKITGAAYDEQARCPQWEEFVTWAMGDDAEMVTFMQRLLGASLLGGNPAQRVAFAHGGGANGKSVMFEVLAEVLGDYAATANRDQFMRTYSGGSKDYGLAALMGVRFLQVAETGDGRRFDEEALKDFSGGDVVTARHPYGRPFSYKPKASIFIRGNHRPAVSGQDDGFWRRMLLIPFEAHVTEPERDERLTARLLAERDGILKWLVDGCIVYQREGLAVPAVVRRATAEYRDDEFELAEFVAECCEVGAQCEGSGQSVYNRYKRWAEAADEPALSRNKFGRILGGRFTRKRTNRGSMYTGLRPRDGAEF